MHQVCIDVHGKVVPYSHHVHVPNRAASSPRTLAHDELGPGNVLRVTLPTDEEIRGKCGSNPHAEEAARGELQAGSI